MPEPRRLPALCELLSRAYRGNQHRGRAEVKKSWFLELGTRGADRAVRAPRRATSARRCWPTTSRRPSCWRARGRRCSPIASTSSCSAPAGRSRRPRLRAQRAARRAAQAAGGGDPPGAVPHARGVQGARGARVHRQGYILADQRRPRLFTPEQYFKTQARDGAAVRRHAGGARQQRGDRPPLQPRDRAGHEPSCRRSPRPTTSAWTTTCAARRWRASSAGWKRCIPMPASASAGGRAIASGSSSRSRPSSRWASPATS